MTYEAQLAAWGAATMAPFILNLGMRRGPDAVGLSIMLVLIWVLGRVFWSLWSPPASMQLYPLIDAAAGMTAFTAWMTRPTWWKLVLTGLFLVQLALHVAFWAAQPVEGSLSRYIALNNLCYAMQLVVVAWPGGWRLVTHHLFRALPRGLGTFRHARLGPWP
jgi:hypothetical protein